MFRLVGTDPTALRALPAARRRLRPTTIAPRRDGGFRDALRRPAHQLASGEATAIIAAAGMVFALVFLNWFQAGRYYATGDLGLFHRAGTAAEFGALWTHENSGAGGAAYSVVRLPELLFIALARLLGGGEPLAERLLFSSMFAWAAGAGAALLKRFCANRAVVAAGGVLAAFNLFNLTALPNYLAVVVIGVLAAFTAVGIDAARQGRSRWLALTAATLPMTYVSLNPPLVAVVLVWLVLLPVVAAALTGTGRSGMRAVALSLLRSGPVALLLNGWWIAPQFVAITQARAAGTIGAETDATSWAWTQRNHSLANVLTFRSSWTWPDPASHGLAAEVLGRPSVAWLAWLLPAGLAAAPLLVRRRRRLSAVLALGCLPLWVVGKGLHAPGKAFNQFLYDHVPGFWLLREPMSKVGMVPLLAMLIAWALCVEQLVSWLPTVIDRRRRVVLAGMATLLAGGPILFGWPMFSGHVTHSAQPGRHEQVALPAGWRELADTLNDTPSTGKVLVLPLVDFYQMPTTWGFYGTDTLVRGLIRRPAVMRNPQGYLTDLPALDQLVRTTERAIAEGRADAVPALLRTLGVSEVLLRFDFDRASPIRSVSITDADRLLAGLQAVPGLQHRFSNTIGTIFSLPGDVAPVQLYDGLVGYRDWQDQMKVAAVAGALPEGYALTDDPAAADDLVGQMWAGAVDAGDLLVDDDPGPVRVTRAGGAPLRYRLTVAPAEDPADAAPRWRLRADEVAPPVLGGVGLTPRTALDVDLGVLAPAGLLVDGQLFSVGADHPDPVVTLRPNSTVQPAIAEADVAGPISGLQDCYRYDERGSEAAGLATSDLEVLTAAGERRPGVELEAVDHRACRTVDIAQPVAAAMIHIRLLWRSVEGAAPDACLWLEGPNRCVGLPAPSAADSEGWVLLDGTVALPADAVAARLFLYADRAPAGAARTVTEYSVPELTRLRATEAMVVAPVAPLTQSMAIAAGSLALSSEPTALTAPAAWSEVGDCHRVDDRDYGALGLRAESLSAPAGALRLSATEHIACVHSTLPPTTAGLDYTLSVPYRTVRGSTARLCVFDTVEHRCLPLEGDVVDRSRLANSSTWRTALVRVTATGHPLDLYAYADGAAGGTVVDYGSVGLRTSAAEVITVLRASDAAPAPSAVAARNSFRWNATGTNRYQVHVVSGGRIVLATNESFAPGWELRGLPSSVTVRHVRLDGYRNGWIIEGRGAFDLQIAYPGDRSQNLALIVSLLCAAGVLLRASLGRRRPRPAGAR